MQVKQQRQEFHWISIKLVLKYAQILNIKSVSFYSWFGFLSIILHASLNGEILYMRPSEFCQSKYWSGPKHLSNVFSFFVGNNSSIFFLNHRLTTSWLKKENSYEKLKWYSILKMLCSLLRDTIRSFPHQCAAWIWVNDHYDIPRVSLLTCSFVDWFCIWWCWYYRRRNTCCCHWTTEIARWRFNTPREGESQCWSNLWDSMGNF